MTARWWVIGADRYSLFAPSAMICLSAAPRTRRNRAGAGRPSDPHDVSMLVEYPTYRREGSRGKIDASFSGEERERPKGLHGDPLDGRLPAMASGLRGFTHGLQPPEANATWKNEAGFPLWIRE
jgi:hypothetical protein